MSLEFSGAIRVLFYLLVTVTVTVLRGRNEERRTAVRRKWARRVGPSRELQAARGRHGNCSALLSCERYRDTEPTLG
jgi:hypothetical protein